MRDTIESLQAGRGIAAVAVVVHHSALAARDFGGGSFGPLNYGYLGVDFFFALSGFIIYHSTVNRGRRPRDYAIARFRRVFLPYWPVGIAIALAYVLVPHLSAGSHDWSWLPTLTLAPVDARPALNVAWTLQHEILFYLLFGLFYFADMLWLGLAAWALSIIAFHQHLPFETVNLEFFFGIGAAALYRRGEAHPALMLLAIPAVLLWVYLGPDEAHRALIGFAAACLIGPISQLERKHFSVPRWLVVLGAASYSIYLVHEPLISVVARLTHGPWPILLVSIIAGVAGGFAYHLAIEKRAVSKKVNPEVFAKPTG